MLIFCKFETEFQIFSFNIFIKDLFNQPKPIVMRSKLLSIGLAGIITFLLSGWTLMSPPPNKIVIKTNTVEPFSIVLINPGNFEFVTFSGNVHVNNKVTMWTDGKVHNKNHINYQGVSGIGLTTGDTYHMVSVLNSHYHSNVGSTETFHQTIGIIHNGGDNFNANIHTHLTINANGEVTSMWTKD